MIIPIKLISLSKQKITQSDGAQLELSKTFIRYQLKFTADEWVDLEDESMGIKSETTDFTVVAMKKNIAGAELSLCKGGKRWVVSICVSGLATDIQIYFRRQSEVEATDLFNKIIQYLTDGNQD